jgi:DNA invertase Pin-like site-specific DNA recombinase
MNVFIYTRVSSGQQLDGSGLDRQKESCRSFATAKGWGVARVFEESISGSVDQIDRPLLTEAITLCTPALGVDTIIVERADRIARDLIVSELFFRECRKRGIKVYAADSGEELVMSDVDPTRKLIRQILGALAEWDKAQIVMKLQAGRRRRKAETGKHCGGPAGFGYAPHEEPTVRFIIEKHRAGKSIRKIAYALNMGRDPEVRALPKPQKGCFISPQTIMSVLRRFEYDAKYISAT